MKNIFLQKKRPECIVFYFMNIVFIDYAKCPLFPEKKTHTVAFEIFTLEIGVKNLIFKNKSVK